MSSKLAHFVFPRQRFLFLRSVPTTLPIPNLRQVLAVFVDVSFVVRQFASKKLFGVGAREPNLGTRSITSPTR